MDKLLTIGIPAFKAEKEIIDCIASIQIQTIVDEVGIIIAADDPDDNYEFILNRFPTLDIEILRTVKNTGPGLARQRCLDICKTPWITFIDADDIFASPMALEYLKYGVNSTYTIEVQGAFCQVITVNKKTFMTPRNDISHPWVFGRMYNVKFLKDNDICFTELRAMEDGEFNWKIRMTIDGTAFRIDVVDKPIYLWREGSEHSITRIGREGPNDIPQYNFDLCPIGSTIAAINASNFVKKRNPFNGGVNRFIAEMMVGQYFTYIECVEKKKIFAEQNLFNAKRFYHEAYAPIESTISNDILKQIYTTQLAVKAKDLIGIIPDITFFDFMDKVKTDEYGGEEELKAIRKNLPGDILENDFKTGVSIW